MCAKCERAGLFSPVTSTHVRQHILPTFQGKIIQKSSFCTKKSKMSHYSFNIFVAYIHCFHKKLSYEVNNGSKDKKIIFQIWESTGSPLGVHWEFIKWSLQKSSPNELFTWALQVRSPNEITKLQPGWVYWEPIRSLLGVWRENDLPIEYYQFPKQFFKWTLKMGSLKKLSKWALQIETCLEFARSQLCW